MRRANMAVAFGVLALSLPTGCSLLGLTDVPPQGECDRCEELNLIDLPPDCMSWQCGPDNLCVVDLVDQDGDGAPFPRCALDDRPADCDDLDGENRPGNAEVCDARSNDCDDAIDEGIELSTETVLPVDVTGLSWARGGDGSLLASAMVGQSRIVLVGDEEPADVSPSPQTAVASDTALSAFGSERAVMYVDRDCGALRVLRWAEAVSDPSEALPRLSGCDADNPLVAPVLALSSEQRGLALAQASERAACEASGGGELSAAVITRPADAWTPEATALSLGLNEGLGPAALLAVEEFDFLVARVEADSLRISAVEVDGADLSLTTRELHSEPCGVGCGFPSLASTVVDGVTQVAVAYRAGDCGAGELRLLRFSVDGGELSPVGEALVLASEGPSRVVLAGRPEAPSWAVAWSDGESVRIERAPNEQPIAALVLPTEGRVQQAMNLVYDEAISLALFEPNAAALVREDLACPPRAEPTEE